MTLFKIIKEITNYFFIGRIIKKNKNSKEWKKLGLRVGWFNVIYNVINLPPEVFESEEVYYQAYVIDALKPSNEYLDALNLSEIVQLRVKKIDSEPVYDEDGIIKKQVVAAYLVKYVPLFRYLSAWWCLKWSVLISVLVFLQIKYDVIKFVSDFLIHWTNYLRM